MKRALISSLGLCFAGSFWVACGIGINPMHGSDSPLDPDDPEHPSVIPSATSVEPNNGANGTRVVIRGSGFNSGTRVALGGARCVDVVVRSPQEIECQATRHGVGLVSLETSNASGVTTILQEAFTYRNYLFVAESDMDRVRGFSFEPATETVTQIAGSELSMDTPRSMALHPSGKFLAILSSLNGVAIARLDPQTGAITLVSAPVDASPQVATLVFHPEGRALYVGSTDPLADGGLQTFAFNSETGSLTDLGVIGESGENFGHIFFELATNRIFSVEPFFSNGEIRVYESGDGTTTVSQVPGSPVVLGHASARGAFNREQSYLFTGRDGAEIDIHSISAGGLPVAVSSFEIPLAGFSPVDLKFHPTLDHLYATNNNRLVQLRWVSEAAALQFGAALSVSLEGFDIDGSGTYAAATSDTEMSIIRLDPVSGEPTLAFSPSYGGSGVTNVLFD